jgi:hypothetical protein
MRYAVLLIALWPLVCCDQCDYTIVCVTLSAAVSAGLYVLFALIYELRLLAALGRATRWPR